jgi:hypothetical protein
VRRASRNRRGEEFAALQNKKFVKSTHLCCDIVKDLGLYFRYERSLRFRSQGGHDASYCCNPVDRSVQARSAWM